MMKFFTEAFPESDHPVGLSFVCEFDDIGMPEALRPFKRYLPSGARVDNEYEIFGFSAEPAPTGLYFSMGGREQNGVLRKFRAMIARKPEDLPPPGLEQANSDSGGFAEAMSKALEIFPASNLEFTATFQLIVPLTVAADQLIPDMDRDGGYKVKYHEVELVHPENPSVSINVKLFDNTNVVLLEASCREKEVFNSDFFKRIEERMWIHLKPFVKNVSI